MDKRTKKKIKYLGFIFGLFALQFSLLAIINYPWVEYFDDEEVQEMKDDMMYFSYTHQNHDSGLFIDPEIDKCYRAIDSIRQEDYNLIGKPPILMMNPLSNSRLKNSKEDFFFDYLIEKQNTNGSYSNIAGLGNMYDTFKVIKTINDLNPSFLNSKQEAKINIIKFLSKSLMNYGWGFKYNEYSPPDIISTFYGIYLANQFGAEYLHDNINMTIYLDANLLGETSELTYYGVNAYLEKGLVINAIQNESIENYFELRYNDVEGGYSASEIGISDVQSSFYALSCLYTLNITPTNETKTFNYIVSGIKSDGGFGLNPYTNSTSDFVSGWAATKALTLLQENNNNLSKINTLSYRVNYYNWLYQYQAKNGLFGDITLNSNFLGVLSIYSVEEENLEEYLDIDDVWDFVEDCYDKKKGGYSLRPGDNTSLLATYQAVRIYEMFSKYADIELSDKNKTIDYLTDLQNSDGGFKLGIELDEYLPTLGSISNIFTTLVNTEDSTTISTFWAINSLIILNALEKIKEESLIHWISTCQGADGGFSIVVGFHSDTISTSFALETFKILELDPPSKIAAAEFLKKAQDEDGAFIPIPAISDFFEIPKNFLVTYYASMGLYHYEFQPEEIEDLIDWFENCLSSNTGGAGDQPDFGADLRNTPFAILLLEELQYDQSFNPTPWNNLIFTIFMAEILMILLFGVLKAVSKLNITISKKMKERFAIGEKMSIAYLRRYPAINCENVNIYAGRKLIVDSVTLRLAHGEILGVLGESGAGKSTFVKALLGMRKFTGKVEVYGMDVGRKSRKMRPIYGYVPQDLSKIYQNFTVLQNIIYFAKQYDLTEKEIIYRAKRILTALEIEDKINEKVKNLSGGQMRRASIAMALIHNPVIVWMDEPTSGLDPVVRENLWLALTKINEQFDTTLIVITHYPEESRFCHKVAIFGRNRGMIDYGITRNLLLQLSGRGRTINVFFKDIQDNGLNRLESIMEIDNALENKIGTDFCVFTDSPLDIIIKKIEKEFGKASILKIEQSDSKMEEYFRIKALEVPKLE